MITEYIALGLMVICATSGQILVKKGAVLLVYNQGLRVFLRSFFSRYTVCGAAVVIIAPIFYLYALTAIDLKIAFSFTGLNYVLVFLFSWLFIKEKATVFHFSGTASIIIGVLLFNL